MNEISITELRKKYPKTVRKIEYNALRNNGRGGWEDQARYKAKHEK